MSDTSPHLLEQVAATGPSGGPTYSYRGARIECAPGGHVCGLTMRDHPLNGATFGVVGITTPLGYPRQRRDAAGACSVGY
jgi:hypothetical protein